VISVEKILLCNLKVKLIKVENQKSKKYKNLKKILLVLHILKNFCCCCCVLLLLRFIHYLSLFVKVKNIKSKYEYNNLKWNKKCQKIFGWNTEYKFILNRFF